MPSKPRICVIGTSNSSGGGSYAGQILRSDWVGHTLNRSIGYCSSDMFAFRKRDMDFADFDICLIDFCANDSALFAGGRLDINFIKAAIVDAMTEVARAGCIPIIVIMPLPNCMPDGGAVRKAYVRMAQRLGVPYFDGYKFLSRLVAKHERPEGYDLHKDRMHVSDTVANILAEHLGGAIQTLWADYPRNKSKDRIPGYEYRFFPLGDGLVQRLPIRRRGTSMVETDVVELSGETGVDFNLPAEWEMTAFAADFSRGRGVMTISGAASIRLRLTGKVYAENPEDRMVLGFYPLPFAVPPLRDTLRINLSSRGRADVEVTPNAPQPPPGAEAHAVLAGLTARRKSSLPFLRLFREAVDLCGMIDDDAFERSRKLLGPAKAEVVSHKITY
jgi:hypothetical protein